MKILFLIPIFLMNCSFLKENPDIVTQVEKLGSTVIEELIEYELNK